MKAVIFDIDDTLVSERDFVYSGYRAVSRSLSEEMGLPDQEIAERLIKLSGDGYARIFDRLYESLGLKPEEGRIAELSALYSHHEPEIHFYGDVLPALKALKEGGMRLGIISDGDPLRQHNKLKACGGEELFDRIIITDELGDLSYRKPDPRSFEIMAEALGSTYEEMAYVGDNPAKDFYIKRIYPIRTVRIVRPYGIYQDREYREGIREDMRIESLAQLTELMLP